MMWSATLTVFLAFINAGFIMAKSHLRRDTSLIAPGLARIGLVVLYLLTYFFHPWDVENGLISDVAISLVFLIDIIVSINYLRNYKKTQEKQRIDIACAFAKLQTKYADFLAMSPYAIFGYNPGTLHLNYANQKMEELLGFKMCQLLEMDMSQLLSPDSLQTFKDRVKAKSNKTEEVSHFIVSFVDSEGDVIDVRITDRFVQNGVVNGLGYAIPV